MGGSTIVEYTSALAVPFFIAGIVFSRQNPFLPSVLGPLGAILAITFHGFVVSVYMDYPLSGILRNWPLAMFSLFSLLGVLFGDRIRYSNRKSNDGEIG